MAFVKDLFSDPKAPATIDPSALIGAQTGATTESARLQAKLNRPNTYTPYGSVINEDVGDDRWTSTQTFSPEMQDLFDIQMATGKGLGEAAQAKVGELPTDPFSLAGIQDFQGAIDYSGLAEIPGMEDFDTARTEAEEAVFGRVWDRLGTQFGEEETALETSLANKGIVQGSELYTKEFDRFNERKNDARTAAAYDSISEGRTAFNNLFANALTSRQQGISERGMDVDRANIKRQQDIQDMLLERGQPMNELAALLQGAPAVQTPQAASMPGVGVAPPDVGGAYALAGQQGQNRYAGQLAQKTAATGGAFDLGAAAIMSDRRLKKNISKVGEYNGLNVYKYRYIWGGPMQIGVMAQEVIKKIPEAVLEVGGWLAVDYSKLGGAQHAY